MVFWFLKVCVVAKSKPPFWEFLNIILPVDPFRSVNSSLEVWRQYYRYVNNLHVSIWSASYSLEKNSGFWQFLNMDLSPILVWIWVSYFSKEVLI